MVPVQPHNTFATAVDIEIARVLGDATPGGLVPLLRVAIEGQENEGPSVRKRRKGWSYGVEGLAVKMRKLVQARPEC